MGSRRGKLPVHPFLTPKIVRDYNQGKTLVVEAVMNALPIPAECEPIRGDPAEIRRRLQLMIDGLEEP